jgi:protoheme IX farnesyltransferase
LFFCSSGLCVGATLAGTALLSSHPVGLALGLSNVVLYGFVYTPLKQRTTLNTPIGAIVGAIPPAIGYLVGGGGVDLGLAGDTEKKNRVV